MDGSELLDLALGAARAAASIHRAHLGRVRVEEWTEKGVADFVTHVDREAEAAIVARIRDAFPDHGVVAEEAATERRGDSGVTMEESPADWQWFIDPLDGTTNYLHRYPAYAVSIGVMFRGALRAGVVVNSVTAEEWTAIEGEGARLNGEPIHVSQIDKMRVALIGTGFPFKAIDHLPRYSQQLDAVIRNSAGVRRAGSAALDLCHVATGYFDGFWEMALAPWDVAAGTLIVREAGGMVTRFDGSADVVGNGSILAGNPTIHSALGRLVNDATSHTEDAGYTAR